MKQSDIYEMKILALLIDDPVRQRCGYGLLYETSKSKKKSAPDDKYFLSHIARIEKTWQAQPINNLMAMGGALMGIGKRNLENPPCRRR